MNQGEVLLFMRLGELAEAFQKERGPKPDRHLPAKPGKRPAGVRKQFGWSLVPQVPGGPDGNRDTACRPLHCDNPSRLRQPWRIQAARGGRKKPPIRELS